MQPYQTAILDQVEKQVQDEVEKRSQSLNQRSSALDERQKELDARSDIIGRQEKKILAQVEEAERTIQTIKKQQAVAEENLKSALADREIILKEIGLKRNDILAREANIKTRWETVIDKEKELLKKADQLEAFRRQLETDERRLKQIVV